MPQPIPIEPPVTIAVLPLRSMRSARAGLVSVAGVLMEQTISSEGGSGVRANHHACSVDLRSCAVQGLAQALIGDERAEAVDGIDDLVELLHQQAVAVLQLSAVHEACVALAQLRQGDG